MKKLITLIYLSAAAISGMAQADNTDYSKKDLHRKTAADRINASVYMGAGIGFYNSSSTPTTTTYVAPVISYAFTQKFKWNVGLLHYNMNGVSFIDRRLPDNTGNRIYSGNLLQVGGQYRVTEKTIVSGGILYNINALSSKQNTYKGATLGVDYKPTPHTTFSIKTTIIQANGWNSPYSNSSFGPHPMSQPGIGYSPFNNMFPTSMSPFNF